MGTVDSWKVGAQVIPLMARLLKVTTTENKENFS